MNSRPETFASGNVTGIAACRNLPAQIYRSRHEAAHAAQTVFTPGNSIKRLRNGIHRRHHGQPDKRNARSRVQIFAGTDLANHFAQ
jgi:hypothetical protein